MKKISMIMTLRNNLLVHINHVKVTYINFVWCYEKVLIQMSTWIIEKTLVKYVYQ